MNLQGLSGIVGAILMMQGLLSGAVWLFKFDCIQALWNLLLVDGIIIFVVSGILLIRAVFRQQITN